MSTAKDNRLLDHCHLCRRMNQLRIDKKHLDKVQQYLYKIQSKYAQAVRDYEADLHAHWEKYGKVKKVNQTSRHTSTSLKKALDDLGMTAEELLKLVS